MIRYCVGFVSRGPAEMDWTLSNCAMIFGVTALGSEET